MKQQNAVRPELAAIVAHAHDRVIGLKGDMPWHLPADLQYFKAVTLGCPIIMGRKTFDSIGRCLPGRDNLVISGSPPSEAGVFEEVSTKMPGTTLSWWSSPAAAAAAGLAKAKHNGARYCFVIGGGGIYGQLLEFCSVLFVTEIDLEVAGDTVFPDYVVNSNYAVDRSPAESKSWHETETVAGQRDEQNSLAHRFVVYRRSERPLPG